MTELEGTEAYTAGAKAAAWYIYNALEKEFFSYRPAPGEVLTPNERNRRKANVQTLFNAARFVATSFELNPEKKLQINLSPRAQFQSEDAN